MQKIATIHGFKHMMEIFEKESRGLLHPEGEAQKGQNFLIARVSQTFWYILLTWDEFGDGGFVY